MYRTLVCVFLCVNAVKAAPQDTSNNSDITYVKLQPVVDNNPTEPIANQRESRIQNIPLTIPSDGKKSNKSDGKVSVNNPAESDQSVGKLSDTNRFDVSQSTQILSDLNLSELNIFDDNQSESNQSDVYLSDNISSESNQFDRHARSDITLPYESSETTEVTEEVTEKSDEAVEHTDGEEARTKSSPPFVPKLSYIKKSKRFGGSYSTNTIEKAEKRRFRSRCRCEKIWNCPKLQISVPRCPDEYFLCCF